MKIVRAYPPNIEQIRKAFDLHPGIVFAYGDTLYNPDDGYVDEPLMAHEETHSRQQEEMGVEEWWEAYIADPQFRIEQEVEAYRNQYQTARSIDPDRNKLVRYAHHLALDLAGPMYGKCISYSQALKRITH